MFPRNHERLTMVLPQAAGPGGRPPALRRSAVAISCAVLASSLLLASCASGGAAAGQAGTLTFALGSDPLVFNPSAPGNGNDTWNVTRQIYDSLLYLNPDTGKLEPWLARSWEANADSTQFTFRLREGVTFSDGTALSARTVAANLDDIKRAGARTTAVAPLRDYAGSQVLDDSTVIVRFSSPNAAFLNALTGVPLAMVSEKSLAIPYDERASGRGVAGSGPYTLASYDKDSTVTLRRREGYRWAPPSFRNRADTRFAQLSFRIVPESSNRAGGLGSGQFDAAGSLAPHDIARLEKKARIISRPNPGTVFGMYLNYDQPLFSDPRVREALAHAVDPRQIRDGSLGDRFAVATSPLASTTQGYADVSAAAPHYDPQRARKLLDAAGWRVGKDGYREKDGERLHLRITYLSIFAPAADSIALLQEQLRAVGVSSSQMVGTVPQVQAQLTSGEYEVVWRNLSNADGDVLRGDFGDIGSASNFVIPDAELQRDLRAQVTIGDAAKRDELLAKIQRELVEKSLFIPVHELTTVIGVADDVGGVDLGADSRLGPLIDAERIARPPR